MEILFPVVVERSQNEGIGTRQCDEPHAKTILEFTSRDVAQIRVIIGRYLLITIAPIDS